MALLKTNTGIGTTNPTSALHVIGDGLVTGIVTATSFSGNINSGVATVTNLTATNATLTNINSSGITTLGVTTVTRLTTQSTFTSGITTSVGGFVGNLTGTATTATKLETTRTFEITGDVVASPITFDGTGNVSLAATIQPNSVELGTDTFGDYVESISGTVGEIDVTGGTGEGSTPVISFSPNPTIGGNVTIGNDLQVNNNLNVTGNITVGGTTGYILVENFRVSDADIVLGFTTDISGNDASNDTSANHGGIAIASTEGNPLITLTNPGVGETLPPTYKKIMWFKAGSFAGLNTDSWLSNYAIGIGSTQFPSGTRLAAGSVQFTENDLAVVRNINASGIITGTLDNTLTLGTSGTGLSGSATYDNSGAATFTVTSNATDANTASTIVARDGSGNFSAGTITANLTGVASTATKLETARDFSVSGDVATASAVSFNGTGNVDLAVTLSNSFDANTSGIITSTGGFVGDLTGNVTGNLTGTATTATNLADAANITTGTIDDARLPATITSDITGNAATATTATNLADAANITTGTISDDRLPDIITSNINATSGVSTISQVIVGSAVTITSSGINASTGIVTALQFVGTASTASFATTAFTLNGTAEGGLSVGTAVTATNIAGGDTGDIPYQSAANTTTFVDASSAGSGQVLLWNGSAPEWGNVSSASGAFGGITIKDEGSTVGTSGSVSTLNFVGSNIVATATAGANGISTVTLSDTPTFDELSVTGISSLTDLNVSGISTFSNNVLVGSGITMYASTGIISATAFYGSGLNLTDLINQRIEGLQIQNEGSDVGVGFSFATLNFIGDYVTATGVGTVANITFTTPPYADVAGIATYATTAGVATALQNSRDFSVSGDVATSSAVSFDGTGNVDLAVTLSNTFSANTSGIITSSGGFVGNLTGTATTATNLADAANITTGTIDSARLTGSYDIDISGNAATATYASNAGIATYATTAGIATNATTAGTATTATNIDISATSSGDTTAYVVLVGNNVTGGQQPFIDNGSLTYNASTNVLTAGGGFSGDGSALTSLNGSQITSGTIPGDRGVTSGSSSSSFIEYNGTTATAGQFDGGTTTPSGTTRLNYGGYLYATRFYGDGSNLTGVSAGTTPTENTTNQAQYIPFYVSTASTDVAGISTQSFVFNPSTKRMGIGTDSPQATLHVVDEFLVSTAGAASTQRISQKAYTTDNGTLSWEGSAGQLFSITNNLTSGSIFSVNDVSGIPSIDVDADGTIQLAPFGTTEYIGVGKTNPQAKLDVSGDALVSGNLGIGTTNPQTNLYVVGDGYFSGIVTATDFNSASDAKLKTNIQSIADPIEKITQINGVSFNWIKDNKPSMGVIADELQKVLPELVSDTDPKTVNYNGIIGLLIEVVKEQQTQINSLNERLSKLE